MSAMYYPAPWQYSDTGEEITVRKPGKTDDGHPYGTFADKYPDSGAILSVGEPEIIGNFVNVLLSSQSGPIEATVTLFSDSGIRLTEPFNVTVGTVPQSHTVEVPSG